MIDFILGINRYWQASPPLQGLPASTPTPSPTPTPTPSPSALAYVPDVTTARYAAYGAQRMVSGYTGDLFQLRRDSDGEILEVAPQAGGDFPDYASIVAWANGAGLTVSAIYDQTGNSRHMLQTVTANQPSFDPSQIFGNAVPILFDGFGRTITATNPETDKYMVATTSGLDGQEMASFMAMQPKTNENQMGYWMGTNAAGDDELIGVMQGLSFNRITVRHGTKNKQINDLDPMASFTPFVHGMSVGSGALTQWTRQGRDATGGVDPASANVERLVLGKALLGNAEFYGQYRLFGIVYYATPVSNADGDTLQAGLETAFGFNSAPEYTVSFIGDSITEGTGSRLLQNMTHYLERELTKSNRLYNFGDHGVTLDSIFGRTSALYADAFQSGVPNVAFIQAGINDIMQGDATLYAEHLTPMVADLQAAGFIVVVCTLLPVETARQGGGTLARYNSYNAEIIGNAAGADYVLDLTSNPTMGPIVAGDDTTKYPDGIHPSSDPGYRALAGEPSGTYADPSTYYGALQNVLRMTELGGTYVP